MFKQYPIQPIHSDPILAWAKLVLLHCCLIGIICELFVTPSVTGCWAQLNWSLIRQVRIRLISAMTESVDFTKDAGIVHFFFFVGSGSIMDSVSSWFYSELFSSDTSSASLSSMGFHLPSGYTLIILLLWRLNVKLCLFFCPFIHLTTGIQFLLNSSLIILGSLYWQMMICHFLYCYWKILTCT